MLNIIFEGRAPRRIYPVNNYDAVNANRMLAQVQCSHESIRFIQGLGVDNALSKLECVECHREWTYNKFRNG